MKAHIGVDEFSSLVHHVTCTAANLGDVTVTHELLHGKEDCVLGDSGYTGAESRPELQDSKAAFLIAKKRGKVKAIKNARDRKQHERWESCKASTRAKVENPFRVIKQQFGYTKVRYRGLAKNSAQVLTLFALSNLWMTRRHFLPAQGQIRLEVPSGASETPLSSKSTAAGDPGTRSPHESGFAGDLLRPSLEERS